MNTKTSAPWRNLFTFGWLALALFGLFALVANAQVLPQASDLVLRTPQVTVVPAFSWASLLNTQVLLALYSIVSSITVWWHVKKSTGLKATLGAVVVGVERAASDPAFADVGKQLKDTIKAVAAQKTTTTGLPVSSILSVAVDTLTPAIKDELDALTATAPATAPTAPTAGFIARGLLGILAAIGLLVGLLGCMNEAQIKKTAISAAQPIGFAAADWLYTNKPAVAPQILADLHLLLADTLGSGTDLPTELTAWEAKETKELGLPAAFVTDLDGVLRTGLVALQSQYQADLKAGLGVTATAILTNFDAGVKQAITNHAPPTAQVRVLLLEPAS